VSRFALVWIAETRKLFSRPSAKVALVVAALLGAAGPLFLRFFGGAGITVNGGDLALDVSAPNALRWALVMRGFFVAQGFLALLAIGSLASELQAHTLREDLARDVGRRTVLFAKWGALALLAAAWLAVQWVVGCLLGLALHPSTGAAAWGDVALGYAAAFAADVSFTAVALAFAAVLRSPAATLLALLLGIVLEWFLGWALWLGREFTQANPDVSPTLAAIVSAGPYLPSAAWSVWSDISSGSAAPASSWAALAAWTILALLVAERTFARTDVP
jgi:ABC-type transport system involved in multi-copper enzyme maturation permease subunit